MADSEPSRSTLKRLFALSGNRCAFPKCRAPLAQGTTLVGEVCHIKGKLPNSPRYDATQSSAERHAFENLILMCPTHHTVIDDDEEAYPVERLQKLKSDNDARAAPIDDQTADAVAAGYALTASVGQLGGITAGTITESNITFHTGQVIDPVIQRRQLKAKEALWNIVLTLREEFSMVMYCDTVFTAKEFDEYFSAGKHNQAFCVLEDYRNPHFAAGKIHSINPERERPFISARLWSIVFIIRAIYGRAAVLIEWSYQKRRYQDWRIDRVMDQLLRSLIPSVHVEEIKKRQITGLQAALGYLQDLYVAESGMQGD